MNSKIPDPFKDLDYSTDKVLFDYLFYIDNKGNYNLDPGFILPIRDGYLGTMFPWDSATHACHSRYDGNNRLNIEPCHSYKFKLIDDCIVVCLDCRCEHGVFETIWIVE